MNSFSYIVSMIVLIGSFSNAADLGRGETDPSSKIPSDSVHSKIEKKEAKHETQNANIAEVLEILLKPIQQEQVQSDGDQTQELSKFINFLLSGNKIVSVKREVISDMEIAYTVDNVQCENSVCGKSGAYYVVMVKNVNGKKVYQALIQKH